jgi:hypothetical protein
MGYYSHYFKSMVVLQNCMDVLKPEHGSCSNSSLTSFHGANEITGIKVEEVTDITEEENQESVTPEVLKMEPDVSFFLVLCTFNKYPELPASLVVPRELCILQLIGCKVPLSHKFKL